MPRKIRELKAMLRSAGFVQRAGKGSHTVWLHTHGATYAEALANGQAVLTLVVEAMQREGHPLPTPARYQPALP